MLQLLNYSNSIYGTISKQLGLLQMSDVMRSSGGPEPEGNISFRCRDNCVRVHVHSSQLHPCDATAVFIY